MAYDYLIVCDSACELNDDMRRTLPIVQVPVTLEIAGNDYLDDGSLDKKTFLSIMRRSTKMPKTASPSPGRFMRHFDQASHIFIVTISSALSSTHQSALIARQLYLEKHPEKFIAIIDSLSASVAETLIAHKIHELMQKNYKPLDVLRHVYAYRNQLHTFVVLHQLTNLKKSGRINHIKGLFASILKIKPVLGTDGKGNIELVESIRGARRSIRRMLDIIGERAPYSLCDRILGISYCNTPDKAHQFGQLAMQRYQFKSYITVEMSCGISLYADEGGLLISY